MPTGKLLLVKVNTKNNFSFVENFPKKDNLFLFSMVTTNLQILSFKAK